MADSTSLDGVLKLLQQFSGKGNTVTTSGGTSTSQTQISQDTLNATLKSALEGNQGLASIAAGQSQNGMYNSTVNQQLTDDLLARLTTNVAKESAVTTKTTPTTTQTTSGASLKDSILPLALMSGGKKVIDKALGYGASALDSATSGGSTAIVEAGANTASDFVNTTTLSGIEAASSNTDFAASIGEAMSGGLADTGASAISDSVLGDIGGGLSDSGVEETATSILDNGTVICTEAARQGLISPFLFACELAHLKSHPLPVQTAAGYHYIAAPVVSWMKRDVRVARFFAKWAEDYIQGDAFGISSARYQFVKRVLLPVCHVVGFFVIKSPVVFFGV